MKTVAQWAEQLPELIKIEFLKEANKQKVLKEKFNQLEYIICLSLIWENTLLGFDFWDAVHENLREHQTSADYIDETIPYTKEEVEGMIIQYADQNDDVCKIMLANVLTNAYFPEIEIMHAPQNIEDNFKASHDNQTTVDYDFAWKGANEPKQKKSSIYSKVINTLKAENEALLQSNTEFEKRHKTLLKANQESMERQVELGTANSNLLSENETLKFTVEAGQEEIQKLYNVIYEQSDEIKEQKADIFHLEETIKLQEETIKTLTQMATTAPKKEKSIFFDLLEHLNIIKK